MTGPFGQFNRRRVVAGAAALLIAAILSVAFAATAPLRAADWPQWRGPTGSGVSAETEIPTRWERDGANVRWRTPLPGTGDSSPIVSNGRVFVTTALIGPLRTPFSNTVAAAAVVLASLVCVLHALTLRRRRRSRVRLAGDAQLVLVWAAITFAAAVTLMRPEAGLGPWLAADGTPLMMLFGLIAVAGLLRSRSTIASIGSTVLLIAAILGAWIKPQIAEPLPLTVVFGLAAVLTARARPPSLPDRLVRSPDRAAAVDEALVTFFSLTFLTLAVVSVLRPEFFWPVEQAGPRWVMSGLFAELGLAAALGRFAPDSRVRAVGSLFLLAAAGLIYFFVPEKPHPAIAGMSVRDIGLVVGVAYALWCDGLFLWRRWHGPASPPASARSVFAGGAMVGLASLVFFPANYGPPPAALEDAVVCVDPATGRILWTQTVFATPWAGAEPRYSVHAHPTPAADGTVVIAHFSAGTACLDYDGRVLWTRPDPQADAPPIFGAAASPVLAGESVIVVVEADTLNCGLLPSPRRSHLMALDRLTGRIKWERHPEDHSDSYATPLVVRRGGITELITVTRKAVVGYEAFTGERIWSAQTPFVQIVASPVLHGDLLIVGGATFGPRGLIAFRLVGTGRQTQAEIAWQTPRSPPECVSPVVVNDRLFTLTDKGILTLLDAETGAQVGKPQRLTADFQAGLTAIRGLVYATDAEGTTTVLDRDGRIIARNALDEEIKASIAPAERSLIIRTRRSLFCIDGRGKPGAAAPGL